MSDNIIKGVNVEGIEPDPQITQFINSIRKLKQGQILGKCNHKLYQIEHYNPTTIMPKDVFIENSKKAISQQLANYLLSDINIKETTHEVDSNVNIKFSDTIKIEFSADLFVFSPEAFKHAIEYCIKELPIERINQIKNISNDTK